MRKQWLTFTLAPLLLASCSCSQHAPSSAVASSAPRAGQAVARTAGSTPEAASTPAAAADAALGPAAKPGQMLRLSLRDTRTHAPIYHAGLTLAGRNNLDWTDRDGRHEWSGGGFPASGSIAIRCPAQRAEVGRKLKTVSYAVQGQLTQIDATIDGSACTEPAEKSATADYAGTFFPYYGHGAFVPCTGMPADVTFYGNIKAAWTNMDGNAKTQFLSALAGASIDTNSQGPIYVEWSGTLTGPGGYGLQNAYAYRLEVTRVAKVTASFPSDCPIAHLD